MNVPRQLSTILFALLHLNAMSQVDLDQRQREMEDQRIALEGDLNDLTGRIDSVKLAIIRRDLRRSGLPALRSSEEVIVHAGHMLVYSEEHEQPRWTAHIATPDLVQGHLARIDSFLPDPLVKTGTAVTADYWMSGYDRGHLVPSADMRWNMEALRGTYLYSNISPQLPELNRETWADLEDWVRRYVNFSDRRVFIVTGPVLRDGLPTIQKTGRQNEVSIPEYFWKVIADLDGEEPKALGFVMRHAKLDGPPISYAVSVDSVESLTGLDFFAALDDGIEDRMEGMREPMDWYGKGDPHFGEVEPLRAPLPKGMFNSVQARHHIGRTATVCGTVVASRRTAKAKAVYLNFDRLQPDHEFYATIWEHNGPNFSYDPETWLMNKRICVTGKITEYEDIPRISINNEKEVMLYEEAIATP